MEPTGLRASSRMLPPAPPDFPPSGWCSDHYASHSSSLFFFSFGKTLTAVKEHVVSLEPPRAELPSHSNDDIDDALTDDLFAALDETGDEDAAADVATDVVMSAES